MKHKILIIVTALLFLSKGALNSQSVPFVKTSVFKNISIKIEKRQDRETYHVVFTPGKAVNDPWKEIAANHPVYYKAYYDSLKNLLSIEKYKGKKRLFYVKFHKKHIPAVFTDNTKAPKETYHFSPQGYLKSVIYRSPETELKKVYTYNSSSGFLQKTDNYINDKKTSSVTYTWEGNRIISKHRFSGSDPVFHTTFRYIKKTNHFETNHDQPKTYEVRTLNKYDNENNLIKTENHFYDNKNTLILQEHNGLHTKYFYNSENRLAKKIIQEKFKKLNREKTKFFYTRETKNDKNVLNEKALPKNILKTEKNVATGKLSQKITVYNSKNSLSQLYALDKSSSGWIYQKEDPDGYKIKYIFNSSHRLAKKIIFKQNELSGFYTFSYDVWGRLNEEVYYSPNHERIRSFRFYYGSGKSKDFFYNRDSLADHINHYHFGGMWFRGNALYNSLKNQIKERKNFLLCGFKNERPTAVNYLESENYSENISRLFKNLRYIKSNNMVKIIVFDKNFEIDHYVRIKTLPYKTEKTIYEFHFYARSPHFFYKERADKTASAKKEYIKGNFSDDADQMTEFLNKAEDRINPHGHKGKEKREYSIRFLVNDKLDLLVGAEKLFYNEMNHPVKQEKLYGQVFKTDYKKHSSAEIIDRYMLKRETGTPQ